MLMLRSAYCCFKLLADRGRAQPCPARIIAALMLFVLVVYGAYQLAAVGDEQKFESWEVRQIRLVQPNDAVTLAVPEPPEGFSSGYPQENGRQPNAWRRPCRDGCSGLKARSKGYFDRAICRTQ